MAIITFVDGNVVTDGTEQELYSITADKHFASWIFLNNLPSAGTVQIRVYVQDTNDSSTLKKYIDDTVTGVPNSPAYFIPFVPTKQYRVTITRVIGANFTLYWQRAQA